jgi:hypothetical protein
MKEDREEKALKDWVWERSLDAMEQMDLDAIKLEMAHSVRTGVPFSVDLFVDGPTMFHLRVEHDGIRFIGRIFRGFSVDTRDQLAIADNGFNGVAEAAHEAIVSPDIIDTFALEEEC